MTGQDSGNLTTLIKLLGLYAAVTVTASGMTSRGNATARMRLWCLIIDSTASPVASARNV